MPEMRCGFPRAIYILILKDFLVTYEHSCALASAGEKTRIWRKWWAVQGLNL
jgi:hypothetical protein